MKIIATIVIALIATATGAHAESMVTAFCGASHENEALVQSEIEPNPDGYYIPELNTQLSHGDRRIIQAVGDEFHLCTRSAATPDMPTNMVHLLKNERAVKFLFVPTCPKAIRPET